MNGDVVGAMAIRIGLLLGEGRGGEGETSTSEHGIQWLVNRGVYAAHKSGGGYRHDSAALSTRDPLSEKKHQSDS